MIGLFLFTVFYLPVNTRHSSGNVRHVSAFYFTAKPFIKAIKNFTIWLPFILLVNTIYIQRYSLERIERKEKNTSLRSKFFGTLKKMLETVAFHQS